MVPERLFHPSTVLWTVGVTLAPLLLPRPLFILLLPFFLEALTVLTIKILQQGGIHTRKSAIWATFNSLPPLIAAMILPALLPSLAILLRGACVMWWGCALTASCNANFRPALAWLTSLRLALMVILLRPWHFMFFAASLLLPVVRWLTLPIFMVWLTDPAALADVSPLRTFRSAWFEQSTPIADERAA